MEGFRHARFPKIELYRPSLNKPLLCDDDPSIIALATDAPAGGQLTIPVLDINNPQQIADFICKQVLDS